MIIVDILDPVRRFLTLPRFDAIKVKRAFNVISMIWLLTSVSVGSVVGVCVINVSVFDAHPFWRRFNVCFLCYGLFMLVSNWLLIRYTDTSVKRTYGIRHPDNRDYFSQRIRCVGYCNICDYVLPYRSFHCVLCSRCVALHDHHCFFVSMCIGHLNRRYFIVFSFWLSLGCWYSLYISSVYMFSPVWSALPLLDYIFLPFMFVRLLFGYVGLFQFLCVFLLHSMVAGVFGATFLFMLQTILVLNGRTSHEWKKKLWSPIKKSVSKWRLIRFCFGPYWILNFFLPIGPFVQLDIKEIEQHYCK